MLGKIQQWIFNSLLQRITSVLCTNCVCAFVGNTVLVKCVAMITSDIISEFCPIQMVLSKAFYYANKKKYLEMKFCDMFRVYTVSGLNNYKYIKHIP